MIQEKKNAHSVELWVCVLLLYAQPYQQRSSFQKLAGKGLRRTSFLVSEFFLGMYLGIAAKKYVWDQRTSLVQQVEIHQSAEVLCMQYVLLCRHQTLFCLRMLTRSECEFWWNWDFWMCFYRKFLNRNWIPCSIFGVLEHPQRKFCIELVFCCKLQNNSWLYQFSLASLHKVCESQIVKLYAQSMNINYMGFVCGSLHLEGSKMTSAEPAVSTCPDTLHDVSTPLSHHPVLFSQWLFRCCIPAVISFDLIVGESIERNCQN